MQLTAANSDALAELLNIGHGRAAAALSEMTGHRIILEVPSIHLVAMEEMDAFLGRSLSGTVVCINQAFAGPLTGNAMLLMDKASASILSNLLERHAIFSREEGVARDVMTEAGNVFLNACLGAFGNLLEIQISFAVPRFELDSVPALLRSISLSGEHLTHAVVAQTRFSLRQSAVSGYLVIIMGLTSLQCVVRGLEQWERGDAGVL